jgi:hypothetical protein
LFVGRCPAVLASLEEFVGRFESIGLELMVNLAAGEGEAVGVFEGCERDYRYVLEHVIVDLGTQFGRRSSKDGRDGIAMAGESCLQTAKN